jgi:hypothetical protein
MVTDLAAAQLRWSFDLGRRDNRRVSMSKSTTHSMDAMMVARQHEFNQQEWNRQQYKAALMTMITMVACGMLLASPTYLPGTP